jgi:hypothetical protein
MIFSVSFTLVFKVSEALWESVLSAGNAWNEGGLFAPLGQSLEGNDSANDPCQNCRLAGPKGRSYPFAVMSR